MLAVRFRRIFTILVLGSFLLSGWSFSSGQTRLDGVVVAEHDAAVRAGMETLEQGGNAVDAAVAAAFVLAVVDPASSGLGGGGVMVVYQSRDKKAHALDFTAVSPAVAPALYRAGAEVRRGRLESGALAVAVPGTVAGLAEALKRFGRLPLETVLAPAIRYATEGFRVAPGLHRAIADNLPALRRRANFSRIFLDSAGAPHAVGGIIRQPELAESLKTIAREGAAAFYEGAVGQAIAARLKQDGGAVTLNDLNSYKPVWRPPLIGSYRGRTVITVPPPSAGGLTLLGLLNVMEGYGPDQFRHNSGAYLHLVAETTKAGTADLLEHLGDPDSSEVPVQRITSRERASAVRKRISLERAGPLPRVRPTENGGTDHIGVLDGDGNAVSMSLALGSPFGARVLVRETGIILNNQMRNFSLAGSGEPADNAPNLLKPRKRPVNGMTPAVLLEDDRPVLIVGASGGSPITGAVLQTILNVVDFRMPLKPAVAAPRIHVPADEGQTVEVEPAVTGEAVKALEGKGHAVRRKPRLGAVQAIAVEGKRITGASDPRKAEAAR